MITVCLSYFNPAAFRDICFIRFYLERILVMKDLMGSRFFSEYPLGLVHILSGMYRLQVQNFFIVSESEGMTDNCI